VDEVFGAGHPPDSVRAWRTAWMGAAPRGVMMVTSPLPAPPPDSGRRWGMERDADLGERIRDDLE
jgi:hypothetical protein